MKRGKLALGTLVATLVVLMASPALAALPTVAFWRMNETSGPMIDASRNNNDGNPTNVVRTGRTYVFNGSTSRVAVPDDNSLDPGNKNITLRASVRVNGRSLDDDSYDVVRKGLSGTPGGDYKMEIKRTGDPTVGRLNCVFNGARGTVNVEAPRDVVDGKWHTHAGAKTSTSVVARVDKKRPHAQAGSAGSISNSREVLVGAKTTNPFDDVFDGSMDYVSIHIAR
jgi:hypothetical protein